MTAKVPKSILDRAEELYKQGLSFREISEIVGRGDETLRRRLKERGVQMRKTSQGRPSPNAITNLPENEICHAYSNNGDSENFLSKEYGVSRNVIRRILKKNNVRIRDQSESEALKWSKMTKDQRENQVLRAHIATKGSVKSDEIKRKIARSRENNFPDWFVGIGEPEMKEFLKTLNIEFYYQKACLSYNLDFLIGRVDLELTGHIGRNKKTNNFIFRRSREIFESFNYKTLYVEFVGVDRLMKNTGLIIDVVNNINSGLLNNGHYFLLRIYEDHHTLTTMA